MKDFFKAAAIFAAGFIAGDIAEGIWKQKLIESIKKDRDRFEDLCERSNKDYNSLLKENDQLRCDIANCRSLNRQVGQYAMQLKKAYDNFME